MTEPQYQITRIENFVKFGHVLFEIYACGQTDRQTYTDTIIAINVGLLFYSQFYGQDAEKAGRENAGDEV